jgi:predicted RNA-binding Zn-ribbon protein involved in translation (DUF1610 family)
MEKRGISVACPVCGAPPGRFCVGLVNQPPHEERRKRVAVFGEMRVEGLNARQRFEKVGIPIARRRQRETQRWARKSGQLTIRFVCPICGGEHVRAECPNLEGGPQS